MTTLFKPEGFPGLPAEWKFEFIKFTPDRLLNQDVNPPQLFISCFKKHHFSTGKVLLILHGLGEHGGRYQHFPHFLDKDVDAIYCLDHQGHGRSFGLRGYVENFNDYVDDAVSFFRKVESLHIQTQPQPKYFLYGHSMGGLITIRLIQNYTQLNLNGVIVSAPLIKTAENVPFLKHFGGLALSYIWDNLEIPNGIDASTVSHDPNVVKSYNEDELNHNKVTPALYREMNKAMVDVQTDVDGNLINYPLLFLIPKDDQLVCANAALDFFKKIKSDNKVCIEFEGFFHEPHNELEKERVFDSISSFIEKIV